VEVPGVEFEFITSSIADDHTCALDLDSALWCWGENDAGQIGIGPETADVLVPTLVSNEAWADVTCGDKHTCAIREDGTMWCWGLNEDGQLGQGDAGLGTDRSTPTPVGGETNWTSVVALEDGVVALRNLGHLWTWGHNSDGQLATGDFDARWSPTAVVPLMTWSALGSGYDSAYGIQADGQLWGWGQNDVSQLGLGLTSSHESLPQRVGTATNWGTVDGSADFACAVRDDGGLYCTGANTYGELGVGDTDMRSTFTPVCFPAP
jgi:alpha-tubulin suppressor-like RCC1 family protein